MKKNKICIKVKENNKQKYPSAEFLYSVSLEDYNRVLSNYDKIYDRINIALPVCSAVLIVFLTGIDIKSIFNWINYTSLEKVAIALYTLFAIGSAVLMTISVINLLVLSRSKELMSFDSNSIASESLYEEQIEDASLWVTLQYIRIINNIRGKIEKKQKSFNNTITLMIISILAYAFSILIYNGGLS